MSLARTTRPANPALRGNCAGLLLNTIGNSRARRLRKRSERRSGQRIFEGAPDGKNGGAGACWGCVYNDRTNMKQSSFKNSWVEYFKGVSRVVANWLTVFRPQVAGFTITNNFPLDPQRLEAAAGRFNWLYRIRTALRDRLKTRSIEPAKLISMDRTKISQAMPHYAVIRIFSHVTGV